MTKANFKKNQLSETVSDILDGDINHTDDATLSNYNWDDLNKLREYRDWETDRKSTRLNSSHSAKSRMPSSA